MLMPMVHAALQQILEWQVPKISKTLNKLTSEAANWAEQIGLQVTAADQRGPHFLGVGFLDGIPDGLLQSLSKEQVFVSIRGKSMRVSPHLFNNLQDLEKLFAILKHQLN